MYVSPWLQAVLLPRLWDVCGVTLPPLSLWHRYILRVSGNPYLGRGEASKDAAVEVLLYCSLDMAGGQRMYNGFYFRRKRTNYILRKIKKLTFEEIDAAVSEYVQACCRVPAHSYKEAKPGEAKGKPVAAPHEWVLAEYAAGGDPAKLEPAFNTPFAKVMCMFDAHRNINGDDDNLMDVQAEERTDRKLEEFERQKQEKMEADNVESTD